MNPIEIFQQEINNAKNIGEMKDIAKRILKTIPAGAERTQLLQSYFHRRNAVAADRRMRAAFGH